MTTGEVRSSTKFLLVSEGPVDDLRELLAGLSLPKRSASFPQDQSAFKPDLPNLIELWGDPSSLEATIQHWPYPVRAWHVRELIPLAYRRTWASGVPSPGLRMISSIHRRSGISRAQFERHWSGPHTVVAKGYTIPVWNYVQNMVVEALGHDSPEDGFVGMHFRSSADLQARWTDYPEEAARGSRDAAEFMDAERSISFIGVETVWSEDSTAYDEETRA
jgi:hypothetical protein